jgi:hypothetical protein
VNRLPLILMLLSLQAQARRDDQRLIASGHKSADESCFGRHERQRFFEVMRGTHGRFVFQNVSPGSYILWVSNRVSGVHLSPGQDL